MVSYRSQPLDDVTHRTKRNVTHRHWSTSHYVIHNHWKTSHYIIHRLWMSHVMSLTGTEWWQGRCRSQWRFSAWAAGESDPRCCRADLQTSQCSEEPEEPSHHYCPATHNRDCYSYSQLANKCFAGVRVFVFSSTFRYQFWNNIILVGAQVFNAPLMIALMFTSTPNAIVWNVREFLFKYF